MGLRIVLVGQAAFGAETFERLRKRHEIVSVYAPPERGGRPDPLATRAEAHGVPLHRPKSMKTDEVYEEVAGSGADLGVLAFVTVIVPERVIEAPRLGSICFHPSLLPAYRGGSAINWQIIRGETRGGLTVFWTDAGIDTGPILLRKEVPIDPDDTAGSYYYEKIFPAGVDAMQEAVDRIASGDAPREPQDESQATYDPLCRAEHVGIDWSRPAREVYDLVRGADPQPGARARLGDEEVCLYDARLGDEAEGSPGTVLAVDEEGLRIALAGGTLRVGRVRIGEGKKVPVGDVAERLPAGTRFASGARA